MPTVSQPGLFNLQVLTSTGAPAANHRIYTYTASTTTHKVAYTESTGTTAHTYTNDGIGGQYIALNARGELPAPLWLQYGAYDIALKDPAGSTIWTRRAEGQLTLGDVGWFAAGTAADPGIAFDGDTNTGIYSPGADQLAISTAGINRVSVAASGDVTVANNLAVTGNETVGGTLTVTGNATVNGDKLTVGGTIVGNTQQITGATTVTLENISIDTVPSGGKLVLVSGNDNTGAAFCALYVLATRPASGSGTALTATVVVRPGSATPTLTFGTSGTNVTLTTGANAGFAWVSVLGY